MNTEHRWTRRSRHGVPGLQAELSRPRVEQHARTQPLWPDDRVRVDR